MKKLLVLAVLCFAQIGVSQTTCGGFYTARCDDLTINYPSTTPTVPAVNTPYTDSAFPLNHIVRVTDASTDSGQSCWTPNDSRRNTFSKDGSHMFVICNSVFYLYSIDWSGTDPVFTLVGAVPDLITSTANAGAEWSFTDANILYLIGSTAQLGTYNINTTTLTTIVDPLNDCSGLSAQFPMGEREYGSHINVSADSTLIAEIIGPEQDLDPVLFIWKTGGGGGCRWFNGKIGSPGTWYGVWGATGTATGDGSLFPANFHGMGMFRDGVTLDAQPAGNSTPPGETGTDFLTIATTYGVWVASPPSRPCWAGHKGENSNTVINPCTDTNNGMDIVESAEGDWTDQTHINPYIPLPTYQFMDTHFSWNSLSSPPIWTTEYYQSLGPGVPPTVLGPYVDEIDAGVNGTVWRLGHSWQTGQGNNGYGVTISQDGRLAIGTSDWLNTLSGRTDVFAWELIPKSQSNSPPGPPGNLIAVPR